MEEIKFRIYDKTYKVMLYNAEKTYDYGCKGDNKVQEYSFADVLNNEQYEVMQYTGLKDKNGKEIYEGDIIDFSYDAFVGNFDTFVAKGKVIFDEGAFWVECIENERLTKGETYLIYTINLDSIEVIR